MDSRKSQNPDGRPLPEPPAKKSKLKKLAWWLAIDLVVAVLIIALLLYRPGRYNPLSPAGFRPGQVSPYLTHQIGPQIYNKAQLGKPFQLTIAQAAVNDIIARANWVHYYDGVMLHSPALVFEPGAVVLMATAEVKGMELVVSVELRPELNSEGLLNLHVASMKVGAVNVTPLARSMARKSYAEQLGDVAVDPEAWENKVISSLINDEPFEPVFEFALPPDGKAVRLRVAGVSVNKGKLVVELLPLRPR